MYYPSYEIFKQKAQSGNLIPIFREILADAETPVSVLHKFRSESHVFLFESVEGGEKWARYSFIGFNPRILFTVRGNEVLIQKDGEITHRSHNGRPLHMLKGLMNKYQPVFIEGLPRFYGGAVGFLGYEMVRFFESLPDVSANDMGIDDAVFMITDTLIIFDRVRHTIKVVACIMTDDRGDIEAHYFQGVQKIESIIARLKNAQPLEPVQPSAEKRVVLRPNIKAERYKEIVQKAKKYIAAGDIIQVVLSQRLEGHYDDDPLTLYRALRYINPSPYLFFLKADDLVLIGSSPEVMVRLEEGIAELRPIAGTRKRGSSEQEDRRLADELLQDPKEKAEHVMLVDLGRNDLGRVAKIGSVQITQLMAVERYSHVMHLVSTIRAQLDAGKDCFDLVQSAFPAGTLTGAPKIRAMQIIEELELSSRGPYGGAVGYFSFTGNMDFCITIRTMVIKENRFYIQAGAGIVFDSEPDAEYQETVNKAEGIVQALRMASHGLELQNMQEER